MPDKETKDVQVLLRITEVERDEWRKAATATNQTLSEYIRSLRSDLAVLTAMVNIPLDETQRGQFERAAKREGRTVSSWLRDLGAAAVAPPSVPQKSQVRISPSGSEFSPSSNIRTPPAFGKSAEAFLAEKGVAVKSAPSQGLIARDPEALGHAKIVHKLAAEYEIDPGAANEKLLELTGGELPPRDCANWHTSPVAQRKLIAWLDFTRPIESTVVLKVPEDDGEEPPF